MPMSTRRVKRGFFIFMILQIQSGLTLYLHADLWQLYHFVPWKQSKSLMQIRSLV